MTRGGESDRPPDSSSALEARVRQAIRDIPDHPRIGVTFKDVTPLLSDAALYAEACAAMAVPFAWENVTHVVAIESRGFLFGGPVAVALGAGIVPLRKAGKLPFRTRREEYQLEYGTDALEIHTDAFAPGSRVLVVDDVIATGGTAVAASRLVAKCGGTVVGYSFLLELTFLAGRGSLTAPAADRENSGVPLVECVIAY